MACEGHGCVHCCRGHRSRSLTSTKNDGGAPRAPWCLCRPSISGSIRGCFNLLNGRRASAWLVRHSPFHYPQAGHEYDDFRFGTGDLGYALAAATRSGIPKYAFPRPVGPMVAQVISSGGASTRVLRSVPGRGVIVPKLKWHRSIAPAASLAARVALHEAHVIGRSVNQARPEAR